MDGEEEAEMEATMEELGFLVTWRFGIGRERERRVVVPPSPREGFAPAAVVHCCRLH